MPKDKWTFLNVFFNTPRGFHKFPHGYQNPSKGKQETLQVFQNILRGKQNPLKVARLSEMGVMNSENVV